MNRARPAGEGLTPFGENDRRQQPQSSAVAMMWYNQQKYKIKNENTKKIVSTKNVVGQIGFAVIQSSVRLQLTEIGVDLRIKSLYETANPV